MSKTDFNWSLINSLHWGVKSDRDACLYDYEAKGKWLRDKFPDDIVEELDLFVSKKTKILMNRVWKRARRKDVSVFISDDQCMDLSTHIIGLGKSQYVSAITNPELAIERYLSQDYTEGFSYIFLPEDVD